MVILNIIKIIDLTSDVNTKTKLKVLKKAYNVLENEKKQTVEKLMLAKNAIEDLKS